MNPFKRMAQWLKPGSRTGGTGRRCATGHSMDPTWEDCPYCKAEQQAREVQADYKTRVVGPDSPEYPGRADTRRITGVLVTYSWSREGELFPVHEGKNLIGSGGGPANGPACDVQVSTDPTLSREHALIRCLGADYEIFDQKSENGTYMNGQLVPVHGMRLEDRARIKTGATLWSFLKIEEAALDVPAPQPDSALLKPTRVRPAAAVDDDDGDDDDAEDAGTSVRTDAGAYRTAVLGVPAASDSNDVKPRV
jgi:hypothetical protein